MLLGILILSSWCSSLRMVMVFPEEFWVRSFLSLCLNHWGRVKHICVGNLTIIGSGNGLSPGRHRAIIWINAGILLIGPLGTNFSEISIKILTFIHENAFESVVCEMAAILFRPQLKESQVTTHTVLIFLLHSTFLNREYNHSYKFIKRPSRYICLS